MVDLFSAAFRRRSIIESRPPVSRIPPTRAASFGFAAVLLLAGAPAAAAADAGHVGPSISTGAAAPDRLDDAASSTPTAHALSPSGLDASTLLGFWVGGGALALVTAGVLVSVTKRRVRRETDPSD